MKDNFPPLLLTLFCQDDDTQALMLLVMLSYTRDAVEIDTAVGEGFLQIWCDGDVFELGPVDGVGFMGGRCPRVFVGDPSGGSVGTKAVVRKVLEPGSILFPVCSDRRCFTNFFPDLGFGPGD
ncbi:hypothetical protein Bca52824_057089 [Brassica carinata]|uniref:Uncharacterized protein n=1 Tax=Brassica carinata TaxID=52824 RepID=A0A8X7QPW0_BRACI|nr:hypothetical protein Bca52824_057089 [Brassica carinata]